MSREPVNSGTTRTITLARLATIFAVTLGITLGLCTVSAITVSTFTGNQAYWLGYLFSAFDVIEAACLTGLLAVGAAALLRWLRNLV